MREENVRDIIVSVKDYIPIEKLPILKNKLQAADDSKMDPILYTKFHNPTVILLMSIFFGIFGVDRFMIGDIGLGVAKLLLGWATFGIWPIIDIFFTYRKSKEINFNNIMIEL